MAGIEIDQRPGVLHDKAYFFKAAFSHDGRPTVIFRSDHSEDLEITVSDDGGLALRRAGVETIEAATVLARKHLDNYRG